MTECINTISQQQVLQPARGMKPESTIPSQHTKRIKARAKTSTQRQAKQLVSYLLPIFLYSLHTSIDTRKQNIHQAAKIGVFAHQVQELESIHKHRTTPRKIKPSSSPPESNKRDLELASDGFSCLYREIGRGGQVAAPPCLYTVDTYELLTCPLVPNPKIKMNEQKKKYQCRLSCKIKRSKVPGVSHFRVNAVLPYPIPISPAAHITLLYNEKCTFCSDLRQHLSHPHVFCGPRV